jgi:chromosome segregation ATPase
MDDVMRDNLRALRASLESARAEIAQHEMRAAALTEAEDTIKRLTADNLELITEVMRLREIVTELTNQKERLVKTITDATEHAAARGRLGVLKILRNG